jgi:hypothetical protein
LPVENKEQVIETVADKKAKKRQLVQCPRCGGNYLKRIRRSGFLEAKVCWIFGYYPWHCSKCLGTFLLRKRGQSKRHRNPVADAE